MQKIEEASADFSSSQDQDGTREERFSDFSSPPK
jgi:hypothetical protein